ncbi:low molecular weight protein arginine phosphatase [Paenibacillus alvei]|uniref:Low molecular weight protein arginine phosphatase n=1 Tax=Paenibacillus alvei TaxID=44250 RepID=A0AAP7DHI6_PAEAL|nr:low molecular weight protein arginine phosphatase [Paenibacillus alvei]
MIRILFVCTGNTCRSPIAEAMLKHMAEERGLEMHVQSAGVAAWDGTPMSQHAAAVLEEQDIGNHHEFRSAVLDEKRVQWADLILTLTTSHKRYVLQQFPSAHNKTFALKEYVSDPEQDQEQYQQLQSLAADIQLKLAMGQAPTEEELVQLAELQSRVPTMDVADPYGGSLEQYRITAAEIQAALARLLDKLQ